MNKSKRGARALRHKNKSSSLEEDETTDSEMEVAPQKQIPTAKTDSNCAALSDFKLQSQIHLEKLEEAYQQSAKNLKRHYKTLILSIDPDILELTQAQFARLQEAYSRQKTNEQADGVTENDQPVKTTQSPNVTSTRRNTRSSNSKQDSADADGSIYATPSKANEDFDDHPEDSDVDMHPAPKNRNSQLVPYQPRNSLQQSFTAPPAVAENPGSLFTGMPLLNLFIPVKNGTAVTILGRPVDDVGNLPEISPTVMRGLEVMQLNISKLTKAWKEQQQRRGSRKSITAGPSNRK